MSEANEKATQLIKLHEAISTIADGVERLACFADSNANSVTAAIPFKDIADSSIEVGYSWNSFRLPIASTVPRGELVRYKGVPYPSAHEAIVSTISIFFIDLRISILLLEEDSFIESLSEIKEVGSPAISDDASSLVSAVQGLTLDEILGAWEAFTRDLICKHFPVSSMEEWDSIRALATQEAAAVDPANIPASSWLPSAPAKDEEKQEWSRPMSKVEAARLLGEEGDPRALRYRLNKLIGDDGHVVKENTKQRYQFRMDWVESIDPDAVGEFRSKNASKS